MTTIHKLKRVRWVQIVCGATLTLPVFLKKTSLIVLLKRAQDLHAAHLFLFCFVLFHLIFAYIVFHVMYIKCCSCKNRVGSVAFVAPKKKRDAGREGL